MNRDNVELFFLAMSAFSSVILVFLNIPIETEFLSWIPTIFSGWIGTTLLAVFSLYILWFIFKSVGSSDVMEAAKAQHLVNNLDSIEGCIENDGVAWRGIAQLDNGRVESIEVPYKPVCPHCQTGLVDRTQDPSLQDQQQNPSYSPQAQPKEVFACPNDTCKHSAERKPAHHDEVKVLFERHVKRIIESNNEEYSLSNLIDNIDDLPTSRRIWKEYAEIAGDEQVSTNCFH